MGGLSESMPLTCSTSLGASLAISGIPPFNGFFSKLIIILAAIKAEFYLLAFLAVLVSIITLASFMKFQKFSFFNKANLSLDRKINEVPFFMCFSMVALAILCLGLSLLIFPGVREIIIDPAVDVLMNTGSYFSAIME